MDRPVHFLRYLLLAVVMGALGLAFAGSTALADSLFTESFDYPVGPLDGNGPPPGSPPGQEAWVALGGAPLVHAPGLRFRKVASAGNAANLGDRGGTGDTASAGLTPVGTDVVWIGFLLAQNQVGSFGYAILTFNDSVGPTAPQFGVIFGTGDLYGIDDGIVPTTRSLTSTAADGSTAWVVVKLDFTTGDQSLFLNPSKLGEPANQTAQARLPMTPEFQASGFDRIVLKVGYNFGSYTFDEIRAGTSFSDLRR